MFYLISFPSFIRFCQFVRKTRKKKNQVESDNRIGNPKCKYDNLCYAFFVHVSWKRENTFCENLWLFNCILMPFTILWEHTNQHLELRILHTTARSQIYQVLNHNIKKKLKIGRAKILKELGFWIIKFNQVKCITAEANFTVTLWHSFMFSLY